MDRVVGERYLAAIYQPTIPFGRAPSQRSAGSLHTAIEFTSVEIRDVHIRTWDIWDAIA
jgi:hypothetical protein